MCRAFQICAKDCSKESIQSASFYYLMQSWLLLIIKGFFFSFLNKRSTTTGKAAHLSAAELEEDVDVVLVLKMMRKLDDVFVLEGFVQLDFIRYLKENHNTAAVRTNTGAGDFHPCKRLTRSNEQIRVYLVSLVWLGHSALWNHLHRVHLVARKIGHLITSSKPSLQ